MELFPIHRRSPVFLILWCLLLGLAGSASAQKDKDDKLNFYERKEVIKTLPEKYQQWLDDVQYLISTAELQLFLTLEKDYLRDAFIERFWKVRDPYPRSARNELREDYTERLRFAKESFGKFVHDDRTRVLLTNGVPHQRILINCRPIVAPAEVWYYDGSQTVGWEFLLLFYQKWGTGIYRLWEPTFGIQDLSLDGTAVTSRAINDRCRIDEAEALLAALNFLSSQGGQLGAQTLLARVVTTPEPPQKEWVETFASYTTELPKGAQTFEAELQVGYPGRRQSRTVVQGAVAIEPSKVAPVVMAGGLTETYNLLLTGEVLREETLFDSFRYQFDFPSSGLPEQFPLVFQRTLRPGTYTLMVKVEDLGSRAFYREERVIEVPNVEKAPPAVLDEETARVLREANATLRDGEASVQIGQLMGEWQTGLVRIEAMTLGDGIDNVTFSLDSRPILTKKVPPYSVELDLGDVPRPRVLRVEAEDAEGEILASDEKLINAGDHRFDIRLEEPRPGRKYRRSLRAEANVVVPKGEVVQRVEFYLNEEKVSTLYQEPWVHPIVLPESEELISYVRTVAYTPDGATAEDIVFINAPDNLEEIDVEFVELYTLALGRDNRPVEGLVEADFSVLEDGVAQEIVRFELVENLPIHAAILLDVSASMEDRLESARDAAVHFFQETIQPRDRATTIVFNDHPNLTLDFTNDVEALSANLAGVKAERGTALYDALVYTLYYFNGIKGQRAVILLSDGRDESSRFDFDQVLEYAHRSGVAIYAIGLEIPRSEIDARRVLRRLAEQTGGRTFFPDDSAELRSIYDTIQKELRSRYLLAYQSSNTSDRDDFRAIEVEVARSGVEAKTLRGYYP
ncbi:MAG: VWA domain-containing protein [Acidobacteriota bacterium]